MRWSDSLHLGWGTVVCDFDTDLGMSGLKALMNINVRVLNVILQQNATLLEMVFVLKFHRIVTMKCC